MNELQDDRGRAESINADALLDYLVKMRESTVTLTPDGLQKLKEMPWNNSIDIIQFVYSQGFRAAVEQMMRNLK